MKYKHIIHLALMALTTYYPMGNGTSNHNVMAAASSTPAPSPKPKPQDPEPPVWAAMIDGRP